MQRNAKGMGTFITLTSGKVVMRKGVGVNEQGKRKILQVTCTSKAACIKAMKVKEEEYLRSIRDYTLAPTLTVEELCTWHLNHQIERGQLKAKSIDRRELTIRKHIGESEIGKLQVRSLTSLDVEACISKMLTSQKLSVSSIQKVLDVLNAAYDFGVRYKYVSENVVSSVKKDLYREIKKQNVKTEKDADIIVLSVEEELLFKKEALRVRNGKLVYPSALYFLFLLETGLRVGEAISLRYRDYDEEYGYLTVNKSSSIVKNRVVDAPTKTVNTEGLTKNNRSRVLELSEDAKDILSQIKLNASDTNSDALIMPTKTGHKNTATNLEHQLARIYKAIGLENLGGSLHVLRRTKATRLFEAGARELEVAAYLGDTVDTARKHYIASRKKVVHNNGSVQHIVSLPGVQNQAESIGN